MSGRVDYTQGPLLPHILKLAWPAALAFQFTLYNMLIDLYYAGGISVSAQAALGICFPVFFLFIAIGQGLNQGTAALISVAFGQNETDRARRLLGQAILFSGLMAGLTGVLVLLAGTDAIRLLGATPDIIGDARTYILVTIPAGMIGVIAIVFNAGLSPQGQTRPVAAAAGVSVIINFTLTPLFVSTFGWGIGGIATSTIFANAGFILILGLFLFRSPLGRMLRRTDFRPRSVLLTDIVRQSVPATLNMLTVLGGYAVLSSFFLTFGPAAAAAMIVTTRLTQIVMLPAMGFNVTALVIAGQNFGAGNFARIRQMLLQAQIVALGLTIAGALIVWSLRAPLIGWFSSGDEVQAIAETYLFWSMLFLPALSMGFIATSALQGMKQPVFGFLLNSTRLIIGPLLVMPLLIGWYGIDGIWRSEIMIYWALALFAVGFALARIRKSEVRMSVG